MKQLQKWFDLLAGVVGEEEARLARVREIFAPSDLTHLQKPACWRRRARVGAAA